MKTFTLKTLRNTTLLLLGALLLITERSLGQACTPLGDQTTYGSGTTWIGYVYSDKTLTTYKGYVNEGSAGSSNFDESFGGDIVTYNTNGCSITTENFSVRYKLKQTFANGNYLFTVGGDDGYRLSLDGGTTWAINNWGDHSYASSTYTIALNGTYNMVLEYYENGGQNRISFNIVPICSGAGDPSIYGTNNVWQGYLYQGMNFDQYKGSVTEGTSTSPNFNENFGTSNGTYNTSSCSIQTEKFSARYRLAQDLVAGNYKITVGGDDGYRFSLDGGATWAINNWGDHAYATTTLNTTVPGGVKNLVLEYYENSGYNNVSFNLTPTLLPVTLVTWSVSELAAGGQQLKWTSTDAVNFDHFMVQRSTDAVTFSDLRSIAGTTGSTGMTQSYSVTDAFTFDGAVYYRLVMVDKDGSINYSNIVSIALNNGRGNKIYPTVVENGNLFVEAAHPISGARLELFDMNGRKLQEKNWADLSGRQQLTLSPNGHAGLTPGCYVVRLSNPTSILAKQIIIVK